MSEAIIEKVDHVQLPVNDIDQAVKRYTNTLGFEPLNQMPHCAWLKLNEGPVLMFHLAPASSIVRWLTNDDFPMPAFMFLTKNINLLKERLVKLLLNSIVIDKYKEDEYQLHLVPF